MTRTAAKDSGVPLEWEIVAGDRARITRAIIDRALTADLSVVDRWTPLESGDNWAVDDLPPTAAGRGAPPARRRDR